jgi:hypothetical protein
MSHTQTMRAPSWRARLPLILTVVFLTAAAVIVLARVLGFWQGGAFGSTDVGVQYVTDGGGTDARGVVNSPLKVQARIPWSTGSQETILSAVTLELVDEAGNPARFGPSSPTEPLAMKPTLDITVWEWRGSVPSEPGKYTARIGITALYNTERDGTYEMTARPLEAVPEAGPALTSGYAFSQDSNLWLLSTDLTRQRRLTYFPEFFEYADKPAWSPDGGTIAFTYSPATEQGSLPATDIWQVRPDSQDPRPLITHAEGESLFDPAFSSDGRYMYFTVDKSATTGGGLELGAPIGTQVRIDRLDTESGERSQWMEQSQMPSAGGVGDQVAYLEYVPAPPNAAGLVAPPQRLMVADRDGKSPRVVLDENAFQAMYMPRISPSGKWIAFAAVNLAPPSAQPQGALFDPLALLGLKPRTASAHGLPWDVYLVPSAGGVAVRLSKLDEDQPYPAWLDDSTIAFMGVTGLYRLQIDSDGALVGQPVKVHEGAPHGGLTWHAP